MGQGGSIPDVQNYGVGTMGPIGPMGPLGPVGPIGTMGPMGLPGTMGPIGLTGPIGPQGQTGMDGTMGPIGPMGLIGTMGPIGPMGPQGPASGTMGPMGPAGTMGPIGLAAIKSISVLNTIGTLGFTLNDGTVNPIPSNFTSELVKGNSLWCADGNICSLPDNKNTIVFGTTGSNISARPDGNGLIFNAKGRLSKFYSDQTILDDTRLINGLGPHMINFYLKTNKCFDSGNIGTSGSNTGEWECNVNSKNQHWYYHPLTGQLKSRGSGLCLDTYDSAWNLKTCNASNINQKFEMDKGLLRAYNGGYTTCVSSNNTQRKAACNNSDNGQALMFTDIP